MIIKYLDTRLLSRPFIIVVTFFLQLFGFKKETKNKKAKGCYSGTGPLSNQGEKSINLHFIRVPLRKKY